MSSSPSLRTGLQSSSNIVARPSQVTYVLLISNSAELEMTVNMLIQIDKLVQLLESPVFTCNLISIQDQQTLLTLPYRSATTTS
jgi:hypothetical protein